MNKKLLKYIKIIITVVIAILFVWFVVIWPMYSFKQDEKTMGKAAKRYFELNPTQLPTGSRIATVTMETLYHQAYLKEDFYIPYTKEPCSLKESWVKVKKEKGEYKYYTYLKCGALKSNVDNKGPQITLKGNREITIDIGAEYKEPGIKSIVDNSDGKIKNSEIIINSSKVDTSKVGTYEVTYTALDSLKNKTTEIRKVKVVSKIKNAVEKATDKKGYYIGKEPNNYLMLSGMLFRIVGLDGENVKIIADKDIANVSYTDIDKWLEYYMEHINESAKKLLVKNKYCSMDLTYSSLDTTECHKYTKEKYAHIISIDDINKSTDNTGSYLKPGTMSWTANSKDKEKAYATRNIFFGNVSNYKFLDESKTLNYGVRPVLTVKGNTLIKSGKGTIESPYEFGETKQAKSDDKLNTRYPGEYVEYAGMLWRIIEINDDGTTKVISNDNIKKDGLAIQTKYETTNKSKIYNPTEKGNIGYYINNRVSEFIDTSYFVNKEIMVPIYKDEIQYKKEKTNKKYKVKLSAPNMYEMFSATPGPTTSSYWLINSSNKQYYKGTVSDIGVVINGEIGDYTKFGVRVVGNFNKTVSITKGKGTETKPYGITK